MPILETSSSLFSSRDRASPKHSSMNLKQQKKIGSHGSGCRTNTSSGGSVKQLVRSLSDRYASVTSPLTCKKRTSLSTTNSNKSMAIKTMKTTAATSIADHVHSKRVQDSTSTNSSSLSQPAAKHFQPVLSSLDKKLGFVHGRGARSVNSSETSHSYRFSKDADAESISLTASRSSYGGFSSVVSCNTSPVLPQLSPESKEPNLDKLLQAFENDQKHRPATQWDQLDALFQIKHEELDSMRAAGLLLKDLCMKQSEEIKLLKNAFPATLREVARLRDECIKQEKELAESRTLIPALQTHIRLLEEKVDALSADFKQMKHGKEDSPEPANVQVHERETSNSCDSTLSIDHLALNSSGYLESVNWGRKSRSSTSLAMPSDEKSLSSTTPPSPSKQDSATRKLDSISWGRKSRSNSSIPDEKSMPSTTPSSPSKKNNMTTSEAPQKYGSSDGKHRRGFSAVLSTEQLLKGTSKKAGRSISENEIADTLRELNHAADKENNLLQERCVNVLKDLRSSSSRFANFEPLKSILICASPRFYRGGIENEIGTPRSFTDWNLKPT